MATTQSADSTPSPVRCYTRALKNAQFLQEQAPDRFAVDPDAEGFGTGVPLEILQGLHRMAPDSPALHDHPLVADVLRATQLPTPGPALREPLFNGAIHFVQITFRLPDGSTRMVRTEDLTVIVQYAQRAIRPITRYISQYGATRVRIAPTIIPYRVRITDPTRPVNRALLGEWVNTIAANNNLPANSCVVLIIPQGVLVKGTGPGAGFHAKANIPYIVGGVFTIGLQIADRDDAFAMLVSHEIAEMIVDPTVDLVNPEVCDPCDNNCANLTRDYFDQNDAYLGSNQGGPGGFPYTYFICGIVKKAVARDCPPPHRLADCGYAPPS